MPYFEEEPGPLHFLKEDDLPHTLLHESILLAIILFHFYSYSFFYFFFFFFFFLIPKGLYGSLVRTKYIKKSPACFAQKLYLIFASSESQEDVIVIQNNRTVRRISSYTVAMFWLNCFGFEKLCPFPLASSRI